MAPAFVQISEKGPRSESFATPVKENLETIREVSLAPKLSMKSSERGSSHSCNA